MTVSADRITTIADGVKNAVLTGPEAKKPHLVFCAAPVVGHTTPMVAVATELTKRGFTITFIGGEEFREKIENAGATCVGMPVLFTPEFEAQRNAVPSGMPRLIFDMENFFVAQTPMRFHKLQDTLAALREQDPAVSVVIVTEPLFMGVNPLHYGAPLPKGYTTRPKIISFSQVPYFAESVITGPFGPGLPPDGSESGRARNKLISQMMVGGPFAGANALQEKIMKELGAVDYKPGGSFFHNCCLDHDAVLQMCPPSLEYERPDVPDHVKFCGTMPPKPVSADLVYPAFWDEVTRGDRRVVMVAQGTVALDYSELLVPTMRALADRDDVLVVAILGKKGASLAADVAVPANARVVDYLPYDALLPHAAAFVFNAGYGGLLHGVCHGVPMVLGGETEDKPEVAMRAEWSGVALNLRTARPEDRAVREAVDRVLAEPAFKKKVMAIKAENEALGALDLVEEQIMAFA